MDRYKEALDKLEEAKLAVDKALEDTLKEFTSKLKAGAFGVHNTGTRELVIFHYLKSRGNESRWCAFPVYKLDAYLSNERRGWDDIRNFAEFCEVTKDNVIRFEIVEDAFEIVELIKAKAATEAGRINGVVRANWN